MVSILLNKLLLAHIVNPQKLLKTACVIQFKDLSAKTATSLSQFAPTQLQNMQNSVELNGVVEADETFFALSFKGNHKKSTTFTMPRKAHKRG